MSAYSHDLEVRIVSHDRAAVAEIVGNVDTVSAESLITALHDAIAGGQPRLVCDMSGVGYTSSAGLRALLGAMKEARSNGGDLRLAAVEARVLKVLQLSGFTSILRLFPDVPSALASYVD